ncbi:MAG: RNA polymerase sigma factor [Deltaproteobacteria bacterium]
MRDAFKRYGPLVYRRALTLLQDPREAEDATQEVFIRAMKNEAQFRKEALVSTWLYRVTTNYCLNLMRNRKNRRRILEEQVRPAQELSTGPETSTVVMVRRLLARADERQARAAVYVYIDGLSREETAELLDCSVRTVGNLLDRFNRWARNEIEAEAEKPQPCAEMQVSRV